ncbi:MAG: hypothetical protein ACJA08_000941 [Cyclobacteriaceae bacterium]|jgi:hypothetical protein
MDIIDIGLFASYVLIALCTIAAIVIPIVQSFDDPQSLVKSGIGLGFVLVVFLIGYILADSESATASEGTAKLVGAGIISMYILLFLALAGIVYTEISKMIK